MTRSFLLALTCLFMLFATSAHAELRVDVTKGTINPIPIAITNFVPVDAAGQEFATQIPSVITADLESTGLFKPLDPRAVFTVRKSSSRAGLRYSASIRLTTNNMPSPCIREELRKPRFLKYSVRPRSQNLRWFEWYITPPASVSS